MAPIEIQFSTIPFIADTPTFLDWTDYDDADKMILMMGLVLMLMITRLLMMMLRTIMAVMMLRMMMAAMMLRMADDMCVRECLFQKIMLTLKMSIGC